jgi:hypothetical protein
MLINWISFDKYLLVAFYVQQVFKPLTGHLNILYSHKCDKSSIYPFNHSSVCRDGASSHRKNITQRIQFGPHALNIYLPIYQNNFLHLTVFSHNIVIPILHTGS